MGSNGHFFIFTIVLIIIWIIVLTTASNNGSKNKLYLSPAETKEYDEGNIRQCKTLCNNCGCLGFYCGEECICECNNGHSDTKCIAITQANARKLQTPFEILIQAPKANNFLRNALQFEQNIERKSNGYQNKRSTVTIYKPNKDWESNYGDIAAIKSIENESAKSNERAKRSTDGTFNWFNDLTNNFVRPAPLGVRKSKSDEPKTLFRGAERVMVSPSFDDTWFSVNTPNILTPAPISKPKINKFSNILYNENPFSREEKSEKNPLPINLHNEEILHSVDTKIEENELNSKEFLESIFMDVHKNSLENKENKDSQEIVFDDLSDSLFKDDTSKLESKITTRIRVPWLNTINFLEKIKSALRI